MSVSQLLQMLCYSSHDSAAKNATVVYDNALDDGHLWKRQVLDDPLPLCSSARPPHNDSCMVCQVDQVVFAVCRLLTDGVEVVMEALAKQVQLSESDCPETLSDGDPQELQPVAITVILPLLLLLLLLIFTIIGVVVYKKCCRKEQREMIPSDGKDECNNMRKEGETSV